MKILPGFKYAWNGIVHCCGNEMNFNIHLLAVVVISFAGFCFSINNTEWLFIIGCCILVLVTEMINTALENLCDIIVAELHPAIKIVKDVAAGAVLLSAAGSMVIACIIFIPKIFK